MKESTFKIRNESNRKIKEALKQRDGRNANIVIGTALYDNGKKVLVSFVRKHGTAFLKAELYDINWNYIKGTQKRTDDIEQFDNAVFKDKEGTRYSMAVQFD